MADHIDLTKDSDDEGQSTFESDAALARRLSAELNGEAPKNNKRTIDLTADSQEEAPPAQRARTSQEYSTKASAAPRQRLSISTMRAAITQAGLATADLVGVERSEVEARYEQALDRLAERARLDAEREARDRARGVTVAPTAPDGSRQLFFVVERRGDRLAAHWNDGGERQPRAGLTRHWQGMRSVSMRTHSEAPATKARVLLAYDSDARRGEAWRRPKMAYRSSGSQYANGATALKSLMQKAARQQKDDISMRAAHELLALPKTGDLFHVLRRLLVISVEDSAPLDGINSVLVWLFAAACGPDWNTNYTPTDFDVAFILGAVGAVARCKGLSNGMKGQPTKLALRTAGFLAEVPLADVWARVLFRGRLACGHARSSGHGGFPRRSRPHLKRRSTSSSQPRSAGLRQITATRSCYCRPRVYSRRAIWWCRRDSRPCRWRRFRASSLEIGCWTSCAPTCRRRALCGNQPVS